MYDAQSQEKIPSLIWTNTHLALLLGLDSAGFADALLALLPDPGYGLPALYSPEIRPALKRLKDTAPESYLGKLVPELRAMGVNTFDLDRHLYTLTSLPAGTSLPPPETLTQLLAAHIPPPLQLVTNLLHEGMLLFGGKSKRGKSWLMFDLALSLATGGYGFRHFDCPAPRPVLFLALEDGRARLQGRARAIQSHLTTADNFHLRYAFPPLAEGGCELLAHEIEQHRYGLVVIDVLAKLESSGKQGEKNYHEVYEMFTPLQALRQQHPFCLAMLTHLRKQDADDAFDSLLGSVAYQGAQDVLWVLERKPKDDFAFLHIRDKDAEDKTIALRFLDGHWEYVGEGEEYELDKERRQILKVLADEKTPMTIQNIMKAANIPEARYPRVRQILMALVKDDMLHRTQRGLYAASIRAAQEYDFDNDDPVPF